MISTNQFKNGKIIKMDGELYYIVKFQHIKPGKGGAFVRTKLKSLKRGTVIDRTFKPGDKFEEAYIDHKELQYLYRAGTSYHFMDTETFEQMDIGNDTLGECVNYIKDNSIVTAAVYGHKIIGIEPTLFVDLEVVDTEPGTRGNTAKAALKSAKLETGLVVQVPLFINQGDVLKIDTRTGEYVTRRSSK